MTRLLNGIVAFGSALLLAVTLIGAGFAAVAIPDAATATLSRAFSGCDQPNTPFTTDELASMAIAGKHYTFDDNDREKLDAAIAEANVAAEVDGRATASARESAARSLPADAISHLDDVYRVACVAKPALVIVAVLCIAGLAHVAVRIGRRALGRTLMAGFARWEHGRPSTSTGCSPPSTACSSRREPGRSPTTACLSPCTQPLFGWAWAASGLQLPAACLYLLYLLVLR